MEDQKVIVSLYSCEKDRFNAGWGTLKPFTGPNLGGMSRERKKELKYTD